MFKIKTVAIFALNIALIIISIMFNKFASGDEYLVIFVIPLMFLIASFVLTVRLTVVLLFMNLAFFVFYRVTGVLDTIDVCVLMLLLSIVSGAGYAVRFLSEAFDLYHKSEMAEVRRRYENIVSDLEATDSRGRKIEDELNHMSRLYEITKKLAPVLKFDDLLNALFDFIELNFKFQTTHLLTFSKEKFSRGISKSIGDEDYYEDADNVLDYERLVNYVRERRSKPFFSERNTDRELFDLMRVRADTFIVFPLLVGDKLCAILAIEGASRSNYVRFQLLVPQIALEFRKVELYEQVQELSIIDGLTEVYLRRYLMDRLEEEVDRAGRLGLTFSIGMVDVDHFKKCNDKFGHLVGDVVLRKIADRLSDSVREVDMVARYGGEEFCVLLPETSKKLALTVAERLRKSVNAKKIKAFDEQMGVSVSIGIATYPEDGKDVTSLIEKSDTALYMAKRKGRNIVCAA